MFKPEIFLSKRPLEREEYQSFTTLALAAAQVHATLALAAANHGEPNRVTKHLEMARKYLAEVED